MNVAPINNNNNTTTPNFGVLKIDKKLAPQLVNKSPDYIQRLKTIGEELANTTRFHVVLKDDCIPKVYAENVIAYGQRDFFEELKNKIEPSLEKPYYITNGEETVSGFNPKVPRIFIDLYKEEIQQEKYEEFSKLDILEQAVEYSKLLDKKTAITEERELAKRLAQEKEEEDARIAKKEHESNVASLLDLYSFESENVEEIKSKKKWWQKFF